MPWAPGNRHIAGENRTAAYLKYCGKQKLDTGDGLKKNFESISVAYISPGSGCVSKSHSVGYVELVFECLS